MSCKRFLWVLVLASGLAHAVDIDGTITYQAQIKQNGTPANGSFDFQFKLFDSASVGTGAQVGTLDTLDNVVLSNGQLSANLNFGNSTIFTGTQLFLEIGIRDGNSNSAYTLLNPRQRLTEVPYAGHSVQADMAFLTAANSVNAGSVVDGSLGSADVNTTQVQRRVTGTCTAGNAIRTVAQDGTVTCEPVGGGGGGGVTSITAGTGLSGGTIVSTGTIAIANGGVGATQINSTQVQRRNGGMATTCAGTGLSIKTIAEDGSVTCEAGGGGGGGGWNLTGNSGLSATTNFLGTTDNVPVRIRSNNERVMDLQTVTGAINAAGTQGTGGNVLGGSKENSIQVGVVAATVAGGGMRSTTPAPNRVTDVAGSVGGGYLNLAGNANASAVDATSATVAGGHNNTASGEASTIGGGNSNSATGENSVVAGGGNNQAIGTNSMVPGGFSNQAGGNASFAAGTRALVPTGENGAFVWADAAGGTSTLSSRGSNTFVARATAGVFFLSNSSGTAGVTLAPGGGSWSNLSDRNVKHGLVSVDAESILERVVGLPLTTWTYNSQDDGIRHLGPMAQDFYAAFNLGEDEKRINSVDADGVALAAIQGLHAKVERENEQLKQQNATLEAKNAELEQRLIRLEQTLLGTEHTAGR